MLRCWRDANSARHRIQLPTMDYNKSVVGGERSLVSYILQIDYQANADWKISLVPEMN